MGDSGAKSDGNRRLTKNEKRRMKKKNQSTSAEDEEIEEKNENRTESATEKQKEKEKGIDSPALLSANSDKENNTNNHSHSNSSSSRNSHLQRERQSETEEDDDDSAVEIEYVAADVEKELSGLDLRLLDQFRGIFSKFSKPEELMQDKHEFGNAAVAAASDPSFSEDAATQQQLVESKRLSKKKKKLSSRLSVAELKQLVQRPDVVEAHDVSSSDPRLLVYLKAYQNTVPVPRHWCQIRKYLQGKRGSEKVPYQLPEFIADTGIAKIRESIMEQEELKKSKQKARERVRPKMGKIDIDYQVLHDAFFKFQTKPKMGIHGDLYFEGKEFEVQMKEKNPGVLSADLIAALGMQDGAPPPWLIAMQRYGPPPSYPNLRIPGLNAPLPPGATYGYHPGGWGKPPVDEYGRPMYGDVFGIATTTEVDNSLGIDKAFKWGAFEYEEEEQESEDEDEDEEEAPEQETGRGKKNRFDTTGLETPSSIDGSSLMSGLETPDTIDLRKREGYETPEVLSNRELYHVIQERKVSAGGQLFGSDRQYVLPGKGDVQLSINPDELEDMLSSKDKLKDAHDAQVYNSQNELLFKHTSSRGGGGDGGETEDDKNKGKKRKAEAPLVYKKVKDFKF